MRLTGSLLNHIAASGPVLRTSNKDSFLGGESDCHGPFDSTIVIILRNTRMSFGAFH